MERVDEAGQVLASIDPEVGLGASRQLAEILDLPVEQAQEMFQNIPAISRIFPALVVATSSFTAGRRPPNAGS